MKLEIGRTYSRKDNPDEKLAAFCMWDVGQGTIVAALEVGKPPKEAHVKHLKWENEELELCKDYDSSVRGLVSLVNSGGISLEYAIHVLNNDFGVTITASKFNDILVDTLNPQE